MQLIFPYKKRIELYLQSQPSPTSVSNMSIQSIQSKVTSIQSSTTLTPEEKITALADIALFARTSSVSVSLPKFCPSAFPERIKWLRQTQGKTQAQVAKTMDISTNTYSRMESGKSTNIDAGMYAVLASTLEVDAEALALSHGVLVGEFKEYAVEYADSLSLVFINFIEGLIKSEESPVTLSVVPTITESVAA